jgi:hypothetical protein
MWNGNKGASRTVIVAMDGSTTARAVADVCRLGRTPLRASHRGIVNGNPHHPERLDAFNRGGKEDVMTSIGTIFVDMALSCLFGMSVTAFLTRPDVLMADMSILPLVDGDSVFVEELCAPFAAEMDVVNGMTMAARRRPSPPRATPRGRNISDEDEYENDGGGGGETDDRIESAMDAANEIGEVVSYSEIWKDENLGDFESLRAIRDFVANCRERDVRSAAGRRGARKGSD